MAIKPHHSSKPGVYLGFCLAALAAIGFAAKAILVKLAYDQTVDAVTLLTLRMLFSAPFFLLVGLRHALQHSQTPLHAKDYLAVLLLGILGYYLSSLLDFIGLQYISAGLERLILFLYPTLVVMLSALLLGKAFGRKEIVALSFSYTGIALVFYEQLHLQSDQLIFGAGCVFASTLTYAIYLIGAGETIARIGASRFTAYAMIHCSSVNATAIDHLERRLWRDEFGCLGCWSGFPGRGSSHLKAR